MRRSCLGGLDIVVSCYSLIRLFHAISGFPAILGDVVLDANLSEGGECELREVILGTGSRVSGGRGGGRRHCVVTKIVLQYYVNQDLT